MGCRLHRAVLIALRMETRYCSARSYSVQARRDSMKKTSFLVASPLAAALSLPTIAKAGPAAQHQFEADKCSGGAKAGKNDCQTANSSCAGSSKKDSRGDAWIYVPAGTCDRLVGGSTKSKI